MPDATFEAVDFASLAGWGDVGGLDEALQAFADCRPALEARATRSDAADYDLCLLDLCKTASEAAGSNGLSRAFFESHFQPHRIIHSEQEGFLTGYYEPILLASREKTTTHSVPLYRRPPELVDLDQRIESGPGGQFLTHARMVNGTPEAFFTRAEIERGALAGRGLEFAYVRDPVDAFFLHVQGSGILEFGDEEQPVRIGYDGKNGHPYTSIGRLVIEQGWIPPAEMSLDKLGAWLRANPERGRDVMWANRSFVFFKELGSVTSIGPSGINDIPLTAGSSLAVDMAYHALGQPIFVNSRALRHAPWCAGEFNRLMIAQDVGSAIVGPERGDIFFGSGQQAGHLAGRTACAGNFYVLRARELGAT